MKRLCSLLLLFVLFAAPAAAQDEDPAPAPQAADVDTTQQVAAAREAAQAWLALADASDYEASWEAAAQMLKDQVSQEQWATAGQQVQAQVGALQSRSFVRGQYSTALPNTPEGEYVVLMYRSQFANAQAQEIVALAREGDEWKVAGYRTRPMQSQQ